MKKDENLYGINKEEFKQITDITEEQMKKHPERAEQILMEYCHMMLRNKILERWEVVLLFNKKFGMCDKDIYKKYHIKPDAMYLRDKEENYNLSVSTYLPHIIEKPEINIDEVNKGAADEVIKSVRIQLSMKGFDGCFEEGSEDCFYVDYFVEKVQKLLDEYREKVNYIKEHEEEDTIEYFSKWDSLKREE